MVARRPALRLDSEHVLAEWVGAALLARWGAWAVGAKMDRYELLEGVNARPERRYGPQITASMLDDLVEQKVLPGPERKRSTLPRPNYQYGSESLRQLTRIRWLKARGLRRNSLLRIYLWLAYFEVPFEIVREDLLIEFSRVRRRILRRVSSTFDPSRRPATERDIRTLANQLGSLDPRLSFGSEFMTVTQIVGAYGLMRFAWDGGVTAALFQGSLNAFGISALPDGQGEALLTAILQAFGGALASPEESDASYESVLTTVDEPAMQDARAILNQLPWVGIKLPRMLKTCGLNSLSQSASLEPQFRVAAKALFQPEFRVIAFTQFLIGICNRSSNALFDRRWLSDIRSFRNAAPASITLRVPSQGVLD